MLLLTAKVVRPNMFRTKLIYTSLILFCSLFVLLLGCQFDDFKEIEELLDRGDAQTALEELEGFLQTEPKNPKILMLLGKSYNELGRYNEAVIQFENAAHLYESEPEKLNEARIELANTYLHIGDRDASFRLLKEVQQSTKNTKVLQKLIELVGDSYKTKQLTKGDSDNYSPMFSPDGTQIAFASFRLDNGEIYLMDLNGRITRRVTYSTDFNDNSPAFLHKPDYIFYSSEPKDTREIKLLIQSSGSTPIFAGLNLTHIHSKVTRSVIPNSFGTRVPRSSHEGNRVVYESNVDENLELFLLELSELDLTQFTPEHIKPKRFTYNDTDDGSPSFFPDGKRIIFVSSRDEVNQLYTINIDGKNERHFNPNRFDCYNPSVSPDGKTIVFMSARYGDWEIYLVDANGKNERQITNDIGRSIQPTFSPDGRYIAFVSDRGDAFHIYLMDLNKPITQQDLVERLHR